MTGDTYRINDTLLTEVQYKGVFGNQDDKCWFVQLFDANEGIICAIVVPYVDIDDFVDEYDVWSYALQSDWYLRI